MIILRAIFAVVIWHQYAILKISYNQLMIRPPGAEKAPGGRYFLILHASSTPEALEAVLKT